KGKGTRMPESRVTVVVLTHNRREQALRTVRALQELPEHAPLIVVDNASSDGTAQALAEAYPDLALLRAPRNLGAAARNVGAAHARTPYVAFCDDDVCWQAGALAQAVALLDAHPRIAV